NSLPPGGVPLAAGPDSLPRGGVPPAAGPDSLPPGGVPPAEARSIPPAGVRPPARGRSRRAGGPGKPFGSAPPGGPRPTPPGPRSPQHDHVRQYEHVPFDGSDMGRNPAMRYEEEARHDAGLEADDRYDERADFPDGEEERYADEYDEH